MINQKKHILANDEMLRKAIHNKDFEVYYQPQIDIQKKELIGAEALVRWTHSELGMIPNSLFIPSAENSGLICEIDRIVLDKVLNDIDTNAFTLKDPINISVNLSAQTIKNEDFQKYLIKRLSEKKRNITFEFTESELISQDTSKTFIKAIKDSGAKLALDDFGTGYCSLQYLMDIDTDCIKIDRSFTSRIKENIKAKKIVEFTINLANSLNLKVVAEGVEDLETSNSLKEMKCHIIQGYYYSKPLSKNSFVEFINTSEYSSFLPKHLGKSPLVS